MILAPSLKYIGMGLMILIGLAVVWLGYQNHQNRVVINQLLKNVDEQGKVLYRLNVLVGQQMQ